MEIEVLKDEKNKYEVKIKEEQHTILNLLSKELFNDKNIEFAGYKVEHPLINEAILSISGKNPKKSIKDAITRIQKQIDDFEKQVSKIK